MSALTGIATPARFFDTKRPSSGSCRDQTCVAPPAIEVARAGAALAEVAARLRAGQVDALDMQRHAFGKLAIISRHARSRVVRAIAMVREISACAPTTR
jgi:hypothetical protein